MLESLKVAGLQACKCIKKKLQGRCFPAKFAEFSRVTFLQPVAASGLCRCRLYLYHHYNTVVWLATQHGFLFHFLFVHIIINHINQLPSLSPRILSVFILLSNATFFTLVSFYYYLFHVLFLPSVSCFDFFFFRSYLLFCCTGLLIHFTFPFMLLSFFLFLLICFFPCFPFSFLFSKRFAWYINQLIGYHEKNSANQYLAPFRSIVVYF